MAVAVLTVATILLTAAPGTVLAASPDDHITVAAQTQILFMAPGAPDTPAPQATFRVEGRAFNVTVESWHHVRAAPGIGSLDPVDVETRRNVIEARFGDGGGAGGDFGNGAVFAIYPQPGRSALAYDYEGPAGARIHTVSSTELMPRAGSWTARPDLAFRYAIAGEHVVFAPANGAHTVTGNFTFYAWDLAFTLTDATRASTFQTGITRNGLTGLAGEERWVWARVDVTDGALTIAGDAPLEVHAVQLDLTTASPADALEASSVNDVGSSTTTRFTASNGHLVSTNLPQLTGVTGTRDTAAALPVPGGVASLWVQGVLVLVALTTGGAILFTARTAHRHHHGKAHAPAGLARLLPVCAWCKHVRDEKGAWSGFESYVRTHTGTQLTHTICPDCFKRQMDE